MEDSEIILEEGEEEEKYRRHHMQSYHIKEEVSFFSRKSLPYVYNMRIKLIDHDHLAPRVHYNLI